MGRRERSRLAVITTVAFALVFQLQTSGTAEDPLPSKILSINLESEKSNYGMGEPIRIRLSVHNNSKEDYYSSPREFPWGYFDIRIVNGDSEPLASKGVRFGSMVGMALAKLPAGKISKFWPINDPYDSWHSSDWERISTWGYDVTAPGTYKITAIPKFTVFTLEGSKKGENFAFTTPSNDVIVQVKP